MIEQSIIRVSLLWAFARGRCPINPASAFLDKYVDVNSFNAHDWI